MVYLELRRTYRRLDIKEHAWMDVARYGRPEQAGHDAARELLAVEIHEGSDEGVHAPKYACGRGNRQ